MSCPGETVCRENDAIQNITMPSGTEYESVGTSYERSTAVKLKRIKPALTPATRGLSKGDETLLRLLSHNHQPGRIIRVGFSPQTATHPEIHKSRVGKHPG